MLMPEYLMVQRKDSLCYVEFIRAKWCPENRQYVMKLFAAMTPTERDRIAKAADFDELWYGFWHNDTYRSYMREYQTARNLFNKLKTGFNLRCVDTGEVIHFSLDYVLSKSTSEYQDTEWGWPKGRRNINESDIRCAIREFSEETGMCPKDISMLSNMKPFEEVFNGSNHVRYRHVYYLAVLSGSAKEKQPFVVERSLQAQEIGQVAWCNHETVLSNIRGHNVERRELFKRVHQLVKNNLFNIMVIAGKGAAAK
ncbi:putative mRNA-decapping protein [Tetrabaena socialis]|uniref:Putative mRNA-decapping protein n=1 Tax=Tetrabaena socialis TaxID=47790 RepID=A0A2J8AJA7_9CHLO|nr:putative mRNA-decapping protein [Tetrabaena socialis]|eukprot:PNH12594.1 putative mRNA-decapping protein [Tetrabaena socialis]